MLSQDEGDELIWYSSIAIIALITIAILVEGCVNGGGYG